MALEQGPCENIKLGAHHPRIPYRKTARYFQTQRYGCMHNQTCACQLIHSSHPPVRKEGEKYISREAAREKRLTNNTHERKMPNSFVVRQQLHIPNDGGQHVYEIARKA